MPATLSRPNPLASALLTGAMCFCTSSADAATILSDYAFAGAAIDIITVTPFDPDLGTLNSVNVTITGVLSVSGVTMPNLPGPVPLPTPYGYAGRVTQDFDGLAGKYFDFDDEAVFEFSGTALGIGEPFSFSNAFNYSFSFTATTDPLGFAFPTVSSIGTMTLTPPARVSGRRSDFLQTLVPIDQIQLVQQWSIVGSSGPDPVITLVTAAGRLQIQYNFTPTSPPEPVPEPASMALVSTALLGLVCARRQRRP